ncbi:hypothetical protein QOZ52_29170, partial [Pseudomonas aeruginosa]|uniref:hypothetical protein n=1 Tax=Pseudomonas aeruginosa TaxID=287 RepID=UPI00345A6729
SLNTLLEKTPVSSKTRLDSLHMVRTGIAPLFLGVFLMLLFLASVAFAMFVPWRQSVAGKGEIIVFSPMERPQTIEAQIPARL